jgi:hypothetical protein
MKIYVNAATRNSSPESAISDLRLELRAALNHADALYQIAFRGGGIDLNDLAQAHMGRATLPNAVSVAVEVNETLSKLRDSIENQRFGGERYG